MWHVELQCFLSRSTSIRTNQEFSLRQILHIHQYQFPRLSFGNNSSYCTCQKGEYLIISWMRPTYLMNVSFWMCVLLLLEIVCFKLRNWCAFEIDIFGSVFSHLVWNYGLTSICLRVQIIQEYAVTFSIITNPDLTTGTNTLTIQYIFV